MTLITPAQSGAVACLLDGLTGAEAAAAMGCSVRAYYSRLREARDRLGDETLTLRRNARSRRRRSWLKAGECS